MLHESAHLQGLTDIPPRLSIENLKLHDARTQASFTRALLLGEVAKAIADAKPASEKAFDREDTDVEAEDEDAELDAGSDDNEEGDSSDCEVHGMSDPWDGVRRCITCAWEIVAGECTSWYGIVPPAASPTS